MSHPTPDQVQPPPDVACRSLRIVIADDDPLVRRAIRHALQGRGHLILGEAADGREAVEMALYHRPDIVLMDVVMPGTDGIAAVRRIRAQDPQMCVVMLSTSEDVEIALEALRSGASGFLIKTLDLRQLPAILERTAAGEAALNPRLALRLIKALGSQSTPVAGSRPVHSQLTDREWEVIDLLDSDLTTTDIADRLVVSLATVRTHIRSVYRKLDVHNRDDLAAVMERLRAPSSPP